MKLDTPIQMTRTLEVREPAIDVEKRTMRILIASETPVAREGFDEILLCGPGNVNMERLGTGRAPLCSNHRLDQQAGVIDSATVAPDRTVRGVARFSKTSPLGLQEFSDYEAGIRSAVSCGYTIEEIEFVPATDGGRDTVVATRWTPLEVSCVALGADPSAGVERSFNSAFPQELIERLREKGSTNMKPETQNSNPTVTVTDTPAEVRRAESQRQNAIRSYAAQHGIEDHIVTRALEAGQSAQEFATEVVLPEIERRQQETRVNPVDLSSAERAKFSVGAWARQLVNGQLGRGSLEQEANRAACRAYGIEERSNAIFLPWEMCKRAVSVTTGTGQHLVPQQHGQFFDFLTATTQIGRLAANWSGLRGDVDIPSGLSLGTAEMLDENADVSDSESTFRNVRLTAHECRTRATFSRRLLENGPMSGNIIENAIMERIAEKVEQQALYGDGDAEQVLGLANVSNITDGDLTGNAVGYSSLVGVKTAVANARALLKGPFSYLTTFPVVGRALSTARFTNGGQSILTASGENEYRMDGDLFLASHLVSQTSPSPTSPSQTVAHDMFAGCFSKAVVMATFGPGILIEANPYLDQVKGNVMFFGTLMWDLGVPVPEAIAYGDNILLS